MHHTLYSQYFILLKGRPFRKNIWVDSNGRYARALKTLGLPYVRFVFFVS